MLVLILAVTLGLLLTILFFGLNYTRLLGGNAEQKKAIEAAALAAASDLGNIVIDTPEMGYVSLSDQAPIGKTTQAGDQYYLPVRGINTVIGTCRLDAIIADKLPNSGAMTQLAANDFTAAKSVLTQLNSALSNACAGGGVQYTDRDGNKVDVAGDAIAAYQQNAYRMSGSATYVPNSLKLTMGSLNTPSDTNVPIPQPTSVENLSASYVTNGNYKSFINVPYNGVNYVFGGVGNTIRLVDSKNFVTNLASVDYQVPTIVKAECDELLKTEQNPSGNTIHAAACAQPSSTFDPRPAPGAVAIEFPDGQVPEFTKPGDLLTKLNQGTTVQTATGGDYPTSPTSSLAPGDGAGGPWPSIGGGSPTTGAGWQITLYDWIRRAGARANISSIIAMNSTSFGTPPPDVAWFAETTTSKSGLINVSALYGNQKIPMGVSHTYKFDTNGNVQYKKQEILPYPFEATSENQLYTQTKGKANGAFVSSTPLISFNSQKIQMPKGIRGRVGSQSGSIKAQVYFQPWYDMYVRDNARVLGKQKGGNHGGEPMDDSLVASSYGTEKGKFTTRIGTDYGAGGAGAGCCDSGGCGGPPCGGPPSGSPPLDGTGMGSPPLLSAESDFGDAPSNRPFSYPPPYVQFAQGPTAGAVRNTYQKTGMAGSIRFRRQVQFDGNLAAITGTNSDGTSQYGNFTSLSDIGYIGARIKGSGIATYSVSDGSGSTGYYPDLDVTDDFKDK
ncbi:MAG TPA: hypothetical protein V6C76_15550 [Drouetiella sp.]